MLGAWWLALARGKRGQRERWSGTEERETPEMEGWWVGGGPTAAVDLAEAGSRRGGNRGRESRHRTERENRDRVMVEEMKQR